ncbi:MAG: potassium channel protein [Deltaproteobacteria bacterium]|nr:potassium channel protein [Deltaproteobacteria bacterium]MDQ3296545.1 potassium channel protein [Myxococcota bacterium]
MKFMIGQLAYLLKQPLHRENLGRLSRLMLILFAMIVLFTILFHVLMVREGQQHSWMSGLYWTLVTMSTLGFGDITFHSDLGRAFTIVVLLTGIFMLLIVIPFAFIRFFYAPWMEAQLKLRAPRSIPADVSGHIVICANDAISTDLRERLQLAHVRHYVLEADPTVAAHMHGDGIPVITGDPQVAATWHAVGITRARAVVTNLSDAVNTNVVLTVRHLAPKVDIIATAEHEDSVDLLQLSGATHVLPIKHRLGEQLANRVNAGHAEVHTLGQYRHLVIGEFPVHQTPLVGRTLRDLALRRRLGVSIVGVWERGRFEPARPDHVLTATSVPVVIGTPEQIMSLNELLVIYDTNYEPLLVIGGGKVGCAAAAALRARGLTVHIIEEDSALVAKLKESADRVILGSAADRDILREAGLDRAPAVILTTNDDSINIYLTVYCRRLNPELRIVSRITHETNLEAVHRAGADFVLSYSSLGAESVFSILQDRSLMMFGAGIELFEVSVPEQLAGKTLAESEIGARSGVNVIAVQQDGEIHPNPAPDTRLPARGELLVVGTHEQRTRFAREFA